MEKSRRLSEKHSSPRVVLSLALSVHDGHEGSENARSEEVSHDQEVVEGESSM